MKESVNILGTKYSIIVKKYNDDAYFKETECNGYCSNSKKSIILCDMHTYDGWNNESEEVICWQMKETLRHEIIHAFFNESGLACNSNCNDGAWARNEEMVDWFALQGPKIYKAWKEVDAL